MAAAPLATLNARVPPARSTRPVVEAPASVPILAVAPDRPVIVTSPFRTSLAGVVPRLSVSVSNVSDALPAVKVVAGSTWSV